MVIASRILDHVSDNASCLRRRATPLALRCDVAQYGSRHSLADQGDFGAAGESGPLVVPAGAGLMLAAEH